MRGVIVDTLQAELAAIGTERARARAEVYRTLALGFRPPAGPREGGRDSCFSNRLRRSLIVLALFPLRDVFAQLETALQRLCSDPDLAEAWSLEHTRLFVGPGRMAAPPYESVYTYPDGRVMGEAAVDALGRYREAGLSLAPEVHELPDHVAEEAAAWTRGDAPEVEGLLSLQASFLADHLLSWTPRFSARLSSATECELYLALARLVEGFPRLDHEQIAVLRATLAPAGKTFGGS
ncbi:MAG: molecular chaperone TorD family protein [candidate division NC10 bacterium]|nr:molecular chaperone TorD family protein [candidate division NC10 bacterium]